MNMITERIKAADMLLKTFPKEALGDGVEKDTPNRVAKMWDELLVGYQQLSYGSPSPPLFWDIRPIRNPPCNSVWEIHLRSIPHMNHG